uniref:Uncharacterized protein n=1 Tax=Arundo donax TaxID=35708 RepID=A0A0A9GHL7_ARUDO
MGRCLVPGFLAVPSCLFCFPRVIAW